MKESVIENTTTLDLSPLLKDATFVESAIGIALELQSIYRVRQSNLQQDSDEHHASLLITF